MEAWVNMTNGDPCLRKAPKEAQAHILPWILGALRFHDVSLCTVRDGCNKSPSPLPLLIA
jgi:hypothetical protein